MSKIDFSTPKERKKVIRSIFQGTILIVLLIIILRALISFSTYEPYDKKVANNKKGFIAISYFGVDRNGDDKLISTKRLDQHLKSLYDQGYKTITQEDIKDYYSKGTPLPDKALFLMFEDGRRDTAIFAQKIMEEYNFKATIMSYAERIIDSQSKFLEADDLKGLEESSYWEMGTNGYRLSYINVYDKDKKYLGEMDSLEFNKISKLLGRDYNHYLMDYIRDEDGVPKETYNEMKNRIDWDYEHMKKIYKDGIGYLPSTYVLMHSNTGAFGNNDNVSEVNEEWIESCFSLNFNREGYSLNTRDSSVYDLTRMQPQAYWYTNHLLMRIKNDIGEDVEFVRGDEKMLSDWDLISGAVQYEDEKLIVTSEEDGNGVIRLKKDVDTNNMYFSTRLTGNKIGKQNVYISTDDSMSRYISIGIEDNNLMVSSKNNGKEIEISNINLNEIDGVNTIDNDIDIRELGDRKLSFEINSGKLTVWIDDEIMIKNQNIDVIEGGRVYLMSSYSDSGWSQRNLSDHVYDGVFGETFISKDKASEEIIYEGRYTGFDKIRFNIDKMCRSVVNWFIKYL